MQEEIQQQNKIPMTGETEARKVATRQMLARREAFALNFTRYIAWGALLAFATLFVIGLLVVKNYPQVLIASFPLLLIVGSGLLYPVLHRRGWGRIGLWSCLFAFLFVLTFNPVVLSDVVISAMLGYSVLIVLANLLLGSRDALVFVLFIVLVLCLYLAWLGPVSQDWFPHLNPTIARLTDAFMGTVALFLVALMVRQAMRDQEGFFVESKLANLQLEDRAKAEQEQREHLQTTVQEYVAYMTEVEQGNLAARLSFDGDGHRADDPLLVLGHQLNQTTESLQGMIARIREAASNLGSAAAEILAAATQQVSGGNEQSAAISQTTATVEEVKTISEQSTERAQAVVDTSQHTVEISRTGRQSVEDTIASMSQIKERVESIAENILALSEQTQQIGEIITTVADIAAQSNMLALNASVEAARAGEHGKGFAVVAEEVRNLAEQSQQATAQVRSILLSIQDGINSTVMATEEGIKVVDDGVQLVAQASEAIEQLADVIDESAQMSMQMMAGGRQQASGVEQIAVAMQNINQVTVQSLASTRQAEKAAQDLNDLARSLTETVEQYQL
jgi:methyl-accepting chemotaxis protein